MARQIGINYGSSSNEKGTDDSPAVVNGDALFTKMIAAAAAAAAVKATSGQLISVTVNTAGTAQLTFYDSVDGTDTGTATILGFIPANATANGIPFWMRNPAKKGIWAASGANTPAVTVGYR